MDMENPSAGPGNAGQPKTASLIEERQQSAPTKVLGWVLIGGFSLLFIGGLFRGHLDFNSLLFVYAGWAILQGSASWLRFVIVMMVPMAVAGTVFFSGSILLHKPLEIENQWVDFRNSKFWLLGVSTVAFFLGVSILAVVAIRSRKLRCWTKTVKIYVGIVATILAIAAAFSAVKWRKERAAGKTFSWEIQAARSHMLAYGGTFSSSSIHSANQTFEPLANVIKVDWNSSPRSSSEIYHRGRDSGPGDPILYSEMLQLPSGEWGEIEMELILPKNP